MSQFGPNKGKPIDVFNDDIPFGDDATEQFLSQDIDFNDPLQVQRAGQALNDLNIDVPRNLKGQITNNQAFQDRIYTLQSKRAQQMVDLNVMVNKSRVDFNNKVQARYRQLEDKNGNPQFGNLVDDIGKFGDEIIKQNSQSLQDPLTRERYAAMFKNEVKNQQLDAKGQARTQQLEYLRGSYDIQHEGLLALAKSNSLMDGGLLIKDFSQQLAIGVDQGVLSEEEAVEKEQNFRKALATDKVTALKEKFDLNTKQAVQAQPGLNVDGVLQGLNPIGDYKAAFLEAGRALNRAHGLTHNKDGSAITKFSDVRPGGVPGAQLAGDGQTKLPRVREAQSKSRVVTSRKDLTPQELGQVVKTLFPGGGPATTQSAFGFGGGNTTGGAIAPAIKRRADLVSTGMSIEDATLQTIDEFLAKGEVSLAASSPARVAKANEKTTQANKGTVEGIDNSIKVAEKEIDELVDQGVMLPNEGTQLKKEIQNKFSSMLKTAAAARTKEAARDITAKNALTKAAGQQVNAVMDLIKSGKQVSPDKLAAVEDSIKGTSLETTYQQQINKAKAMSVFSTLSRDARQRTINETDGALNKEFAALNEKLNKQYADDPVQALVDQEFMQINPIDFNGDNLGEQLEIRGLIADVTEKQTGRVNAGLTNQEIKDFTKAFNQADDAVKSRMLGQISTSMSPRAARELYSSFDKKGQGYLAAAGSFYAQGGEGMAAADIVLAGHKALSSSEFKGKDALNEALEIPEVITKDGSPVKGWKGLTTPGSMINALIGGETGSLFPDKRAFKGMEKQIKERAKLIYAGLTAEKGELGDKSIDSGRLKEAMTLALGGEPIYIGGKQSAVLRPDLNTDAEQVNNMLMSMTRADLGRLGGVKNLDNLITVGALGEKEAITKLFMKDAEYVAQGPGRYEVYVNGLALNNNEGKPFILDTNILSGKEGLVKPKSKSMQDALNGKQMLSQLQDAKEDELLNPESGIITDILAHNNIIQTSDGLKDVSNTAVDDIDAAFKVGSSLDIPGEDIVAFYDIQTNDTGEIGLPAEEFARLAVQHGSKYGITEDMAYSDRAQMAMVGELYKELQGKLEKNGIPATIRDVRAAQVLGINDATKLIKALDTDPNTDITDVFSPTQIAKFPELLSGDVTDVFYKVSDLAFEEDAFEEIENPVGFTMGDEGIEAQEGFLN